ncbi:MAG: hypothetical protein ACTHMJ_03560, partial [Thermomicrobiales bacterium]
MAARILDRYVLACMVLDAAIVLVALAFAESLRRTLPYGLQLADKAYLNLSIYGLALGCWLFSAYHFHLYEWHWTVSL